MNFAFQRSKGLPLNEEKKTNAIFRWHPLGGVRGGVELLIRA